VKRFLAPIRKEKIGAFHRAKGRSVDALSKNARSD